MGKPSYVVLPLKIKLEKMCEKFLEVRGLWAELNYGTDDLNVVQFYKNSLQVLLCSSKNKQAHLLTFYLCYCLLHHTLCHR